MRFDQELMGSLFYCHLLFFRLAAHVSSLSFLRSYLPQAGSAPPSLDFLSDRGATPTATPLYLPTTENPTNYRTVVVERKATVQLPSPPQKDPRIIELEVVELALYLGFLHLAKVLTM